MTSAPAYNVVCGVMVLEEPSGICSCGHNLKGHTERGCCTFGCRCGDRPGQPTKATFEKTSNDWRNRIAGVAARLVKPTCWKCGGEDFSHGLVNGVLCKRWKLGAQSERLGFEEKVADIVGRRPENIEALAVMLKEALS